LLGVSDKPPAPSAPTDPGRPTPTGEAPAADAPAAPPEPDKTQPFKLKDLANKAATKRRRTTGAELLVQRPKQPEVRVPLDRSEMIIGREARCDIVLTEESASGRHARIARNAGGYFELTDLQSQNGVLVDDERVERMTLLDGDAFQIGETKFRIMIGPLPGAEP
jgi:pSer/pThr/pTyr-binding forkhead associated (FHA) protein